MTTTPTGSDLNVSLVISAVPSANVLLGAIFELDAVFHLVIEVFPAKALEDLSLVVLVTPLLLGHHSVDLINRGGGGKVRVCLRVALMSSVCSTKLPDSQPLLLFQPMIDD